jgi:hypothetical protein
MVPVKRLFVDTPYVLGDAANAACGTRYRDCVSWNYAGLIQLCTAISRDRTGMPVVLCYWYDPTIEGCRAAEHDTVAGIPGLKLRLGRTRPGGREGAEPGRHDEHQQNGCHVGRSWAISNGAGPGERWGVPPGSQGPGDRGTGPQLPAMVVQDGEAGSGVIRGPAGAGGQFLSGARARRPIAATTRPCEYGASKARARNLP